jgi:hypothetical protein
MQISLLFGSLLVDCNVLPIVQQFVVEDDSLSIRTRCQAIIVNVHNYHLQLRFRIELASIGVDAFIRRELHVLDCFFGFIKVLAFELQTAGHVACYLMAAWYTARRLRRCGSTLRRGCYGFLALFDSPLLARLEFFARDAIAEALVTGTCSFWQREARAIHICADIMIPHLVLLPVPTNMVCNICPAAQTILLRSFQQ